MFINLLGRNDQTLFKKKSISQNVITLAITSLVCAAVCLFYLIYASDVSNIFTKPTAYDYIFIIFVFLFLLCAALSRLPFLRFSKPFEYTIMFAVQSFSVSLAFLDMSNSQTIMSYNLVNVGLATLLIFNYKRLLAFYALPTVLLITVSTLYIPNLKTSYYVEIFVIFSISVAIAILSEYRRILSFKNKKKVKRQYRALEGALQKQAQLEQDLKQLNEQLEVKVQKRTEDLENARIKLQYEANHDSLTGLPNRRFLEEILPYNFARAKRQNNQIAFLFIDLDGFKVINDTLGHDVGDELLITISKRLSKSIRANDIAARLGGDEFVVVLDSLDDVTIAETVAQKLLAEISHKMSISDNEVGVSASIGISRFPIHGDNLSDIITKADVAMYHVKNTTKNNIIQFDDKMLKVLEEYRVLESSYEHAMANGDFYLVYQPKVDVLNKKVVGCEALLRWRHPLKGLLLPDKFIPIFEKSGAIHDVGIWVVRQVIKQVKSWQEDGFYMPNVSINLSGLQLDKPDLVYRLLSEFAQAGIDPKIIEFELTETTMMTSRGPDAMRSIELLRQCGHQVSIDDFGTGFSSLSYLTELPVSSVKIDKSFIRNLLHGGKELVIVNTILSLAMNMGLKVYAEGVESQRQAEFLCQHKCFLQQGYYHSSPMTADHLKEAVIEWESKISHQIETQCLSKSIHSLTMVNTA